MKIHWDIVFKENPKREDERLADYYRRLEEITGMDEMYIKKTWYHPFHRKQRELDEIRKQHPGLAAEADAVGIPLDSVSHYWRKGEHYSIFSKRTTQKDDYFKLRDELIEDLKTHSPVYPEIKREKKKDSLLSVVDVADPHFGKYASKSETGESYSIEEAENRFFSGIEGLCAKLERENNS